MYKAPIWAGLARCSLTGGYCCHELGPSADQHQTLISTLIPALGPGWPIPSFLSFLGSHCGHSQTIHNNNKF